MIKYDLWDELVILIKTLGQSFPQLFLQHPVSPPPQPTSHYSSLV